MRARARARYELALKDFTLASKTRGHVPPPPVPYTPPAHEYIYCVQYIVHLGH